MVASASKEGTTVGLMNLDFVSLGALFLLALVGPAFVDGGEVVAAQGTNTPVVVVIGLIGAAGIGALLQLTGRAIWNFVWPLHPVGGWKWLATKLADRDIWPWGKPATFRTDIAESTGVKEYTDLADGSEGDKVVIATEYLFYSEAPAELREWVRRRYYRFSDGLSAATAILLGIIGGAFFPHQNPLWQVVLDALLGLVGFATLVFGYDSRQDAKHMEMFWFKVRDWVPSKSRVMISDLEGIGPAYADLLEAAGVDSPVELAHRVPANLAAKLQEVNKAKKLVRRVPGEKVVTGWIEQAKKKLPKTVQH
jgi:hypothetical protein